MAAVKKMLYQQLTDYLKSKLPQLYRNKLLSWIDSGTLINQGEQVTVDSVEMAHIRYKAVLMFDEFPYLKISASLMMALIQQWLNDNDPLRGELDFYESSFDLDISDDATATLTFDVEFQEPITAQKAKNGAIDINGEKYEIKPIEIYYAEEIEVITSVADE